MSENWKKTIKSLRRFVRCQHDWRSMRDELGRREGMMCLNCGARKTEIIIKSGGINPMTDEMREAFEKWAEKEGIEYAARSIAELAWQAAWQARSALPVDDSEAIRILYGEICKSDGIDSDFTTYDSVQNAWLTLKPYLRQPAPVDDGLIAEMEAAKFVIVEPEEHRPAKFNFNLGINRAIALIRTRQPGKVSDA